MILLDTCAIIHAALAPGKLGKVAAAQIQLGISGNTLACSDISLWEIAMLIGRGRVKPDADARLFISRTVQAFRLAVLPISAEIAVLSTDEELFRHKDPCDRIIGATALHHRMPLMTCDSHLQGIRGITTIW